MKLKETLQRKMAAVTLDRLLKYINKDPQKNILRLLGSTRRLLGGIFPEKNLKAMEDVIREGKGPYYQYALNILHDTDHDYLKKFLLGAGVGAGIQGTKQVRANREKYHCNIPFLILLDPTSACNCHCKGCWAAEYGHKNSLTLDELRSVVSQGKALGTHVYMFTGGEPLLRKNDLITLCEENPDCAFLAYTNATLIDEAFCDELLRVGNMTLAIISPRVQPLESPRQCRPRMEVLKC